MIIELNIQDGSNRDSFHKYESSKEAYKALINQVIEDKLYETRNVTVLRFKENDEIVKVVQFAPSHSWDRLLKQVEELPKLCETVLGNLNAALVFHEAFFKKAETYKTTYMCKALSWAAYMEIITSDGSELTKAYIKLVLNQLAEMRGWVFLTREIVTDPIFQGEEEEAIYIKEDEEFNKEDLALNLLLLDDEWMEGISEEKQIKIWWKSLIRRLERNIPSNHIAMGIRP